MMNFWELLKKLDAAGVTFDRFVSGQKGTTIHFPVNFSLSAPIDVPAVRTPDFSNKSSAVRDAAVEATPLQLAESLRAVFYKHHLKKGSDFLESVWLDEFFPVHAAECSRSMYPAVIDTDETGVVISVRQRLDVMDSGGRVIAQYESRFYPGKDGRTVKECRIDSIECKTLTETPNGKMWDSEAV